MATDGKTPEPAHGDGSVPVGGSTETPQQIYPDQQAYSQGSAYAQSAYSSQGAQQTGSTAGYPQGAPYPQGATPAGYPQPQASQRPPMDPKKKKQIILFSALAAGLVLLLISGSVIVNVIGSTLYGPEAKVKAYLSAISQGKATEANKLVDPEVTRDAAALLTNDILTESKALMKNPKVTDVVTRGDSAMVEVSYSIDGTVYDGIIELSKGGKQAAFFDNWTIDKPLLASVYVYANQESAVSVNGVDVDFGKEYELLAYPAAYEIGAPEGTFFEAEAQTFVAATGSKATYDSVDVELTPTKELTDEIQAQVNKYMDTCATETGANPENCNLRSQYYLHFSGEPTFAYKVVKYPVVTVDDSGTRFESTDGQVAATATGELSYPGGRGTGTYTWDEWGITGNIVIDGDKVTIEEIYGF